MTSRTIQALHAPALLGLALLAACGAASTSQSSVVVEPGVTVEVTPRSVELAPSGTAIFAAAVAGTLNTAVLWTVLGTGGGTIDGSGRYTAPATTGSFSVLATSVADSTATGSASVTVAPPGAIDYTVLPPERRTTWSPGIPGGIPNYTNVHTTIDAATYGNGTTDATSAINSALRAAGAVATQANPRVVLLPAGTYRITSPISIDSSHVVLRGAGPGATKIRANQGGWPALSVGNSNYPSSAVNIVGSVPKGSTSLTVASATSFRVGDVIQIDQLDDPSYVFIFDSIYRKRAPGWTNSGPVSPGRTGHSGYRSVTEMKEITAISGNVLTFSPPTRIAFDAGFAPQAWRVISGPNSSGAGIRWAGVEDLYVTGGGNDNIVLDAAAYSWLRNVESDGNPATGVGTIGHHVNCAHCFRSEIRHCYVHHARQIVQGGGAYGIGLTVSSSDNLVEDNIAVYLNKAVLTEVSGGGNVFGYNYIDNVRTSSVAWMEGAANGSHDTFSHMDLWEGNQAANIGCDATHGSSGLLVFFRNYSMGRCSDPAYRAAQTDNLRAFNSDAWNREMSAIGNVLEAFTITYGGRTLPPVYEISSHLVDPQPATIWRLGEMDMRGGGGTFDTQFANPGPNDPGLLPLATYTNKAKEMLFRHGNWDNVTSSIADWQSGYPRTLPNSLYLTSKPSWWGTNPWPWVDAAGSTRVFTLPAKARYDAGRPL